IREDVLQAMISDFMPPDTLEEQWNIPGLEQQIQDVFGLSLPIQTWLDEDPALNEESLRTRILEMITASYLEKEKQAGSEIMRHFEKNVMLQCLDMHWKEHLAAMDHLRQGIHLRGYAQKNPKQEY